MNKAVFIDKDGTLLIDVPFNVNPEFIQFNMNAIKCLKLLQSHHYKLIVITNQPGIALGYFTEHELLSAKQNIEQRLQKHNINLDGFYYCPHHPDSKNKELTIACNCRKPLPGLIRKAAQEHNINLEASWMIGDILHDVEAGNRGGCKTIFLDNGNETEWMINEWRRPDFITSDLLEAAEHICGVPINQYQLNEKLAGL